MIQDLDISVKKSQKVYSASKHVFASGPPRAGTTLLQLVLSAHPMITITPETYFIEQLFRTGFVSRKKLNLNEKEAVIQLMRSDVKLNSWPAFSVDDFLKANPMHPGMTIGQVLDCLFRAYAEQTDSGADFLGNKKELYASGYGPYTKKVFPDAKFVFIVRDPRDVTRSILENLVERSLERAAAVCLDCDRYMAKMMRLFPDDTLVVRYEDLVSEPERVCREVCDFLEVPFDERMLTFYEMNRDGSRLISVTRHIHPHTTTPFNPDLIGQWKKKKSFTVAELQTIEIIARDYMKRYGYRSEAPPGGIAEAVTRLKMLVRFWYRHFRRDITIHMTGLT